MVRFMLMILESTHLTPRYMDRVMLDSLSLIWDAKLDVYNRKTMWYYFYINGDSLYGEIEY